MNTIQFYRKQPGLLLLSITVILIPILTNLLSTLLVEVIGKTPTQILQLIVILVLVMTLVWIFSRFLRQKAKIWVPVQRELQPGPAIGLIVLVGPGGAQRDPLAGSEGPAIEYHLGSDPDHPILKECWLVSSKEAVPVAVVIQKKYESRCHIVIREISNAFDIQETYLLVRKILTQEAMSSGLTPEQLILDFTGGSKPMSVAMVLACQDQYPMQYVVKMPGTVSAPKIITYHPVIDESIPVQ